MPVIKNDLFSCIERNLKEIKNFNTQIWTPQELYDYPGVSVSYLDKAYLSDSINPWDLQDTPANVATFIISQTGTGKTSLIFNKLIPLSVKEKRKVLYLCNRAALCTQIKKIAMEDEFNANLTVNGVEVKNFMQYYTNQGLSELINFGGIDIITYQGFIHNKLLNAKNYGFVVLDESHFFLSDSNFNPFTEEILHKIITSFSNTRRIYLTATPQECMHEIWRYENEIIPYQLHSPSFMRVFYMEENYSYLIPYFFAHQNELIDIISSRSNESWLIFVREKIFGNALRDKLLQVISDIPEVITANTKDSKIYNDLLSKEKMPAKIIITTKILDVGVNIKTSDLNVVLFEGPDIVEAKQMIGRKRVEQGEILKVYFHTPNVSTLKKRAQKLENAIKKTTGLINSFRAGDVMESLEPPLFFDGSSVQINNFHLKKLKIDLNAHYEIVKFLESGATVEEQNLLYAEWVLSHFKGVVYDKSKLFIRRPSAEAADFLKKYVDKIISKSDFQEISSTLVDILGDSRERPRNNAPAIKNVNKMIAPIGFEAKALQTNPVQYKIIKTEEILNEQV
ncbi:MAG: DEAD/DEAH box helicase [Acutalibacteraceae bacterium]|nr:DEAD/DEAH box helicase [Acutalibacteraceae bacterium]